jgi:hypothetical protein
MIEAICNVLILFVLFIFAVWFVIYLIKRLKGDFHHAYGGNRKADIMPRFRKWLK